MELGVTKVLNFKPAFFNADVKPETLQVNLIIGLLKRSIENGTPITVNDIRMIHAEYAFKSYRNGCGWNWYKNADGEKEWRRAKTVEEYFDGYCYEYKSLMWFKNNLGSAIIKGKILAIPIIEI